MNHPDSFPAPFCLHQWLVQPDLNRITGPEGPVRIEPRVMAVLLALADQPNTVVTRLDLLDTVWGDTVVGEEILTRAVSELRRVLGDKARQPRFIETIPHNGYRLIAPLTAPPSAPSAPPDMIESAAPPKGGGSWLRLLIVVLALIGLAVGGPRLLRRAGGWQAPQEAPAAVPLTTYPGREFHPALSPDGSRVAFAWADTQVNGTAIYIKQRNSEAALQLTNEPGWAAWPTWSPDGQTVAFVQTRRGVSAIGLVPGLGGAVRWIHRTAGLIEGLDWSPDGSRLAFAARDTASGRYALLMCDLASLQSSAVPVVRADNAGDFQPRFGPQGRRLAWLGVDGAGGSTVLTANLDGSALQVVTASLSRLQGLAWTTGGRTLVYAASAGGVYRLWQVPVEGGSPRLVPTPGAFAWNPTIARLTGDLAYEEVGVDQDLWRVSLPDRTDWAVSAEPFLPSTRWESAPDFRLDGGAVAFVSARSGSPEVWLATPEGSQPRRLTTLGATAINTLRWAPDGTQLACNVVLSGAAHAMIIDAQSGAFRQLDVEKTPAVFVGWGAGSQTLLFAARSGAGVWQIYRQPLGGGAAAQITRNGGLTAQEASAGQTLYFVRPDRPGLWRRRAGGRVTPELVLPDLQLRDRANWRLDGDRIVWVLRTSGQAVLMEYRLASGATEALAELPGLRGDGLAVLAGQDVFLYPRWGEIAGDLELIPGGGRN